MRSRRNKVSAACRIQPQIMGELTKLTSNTGYCHPAQRDQGGTFMLEPMIGTELSAAAVIRNLAALRTHDHNDAECV
jgi:hypothetical protein